MSDAKFFDRLTRGYMMFGEKGRNVRLAREAKAIQRKATRNGGKISGKERARLTKVNGSLVKYGADNDNEYDNDSYDGYEE